MRVRVVIAVILFFLDTQILGFWFLAAVTTLVVVIRLGWCIVVWLKARRTSALRASIKRLLVYLVAALLSVAVNVGNNWIAKQRAMKIIAACDAFHKDTGTYPKKLDELVPKYLAEIPSAKIALRWNMGTRFIYVSGRTKAGESHSSLMWMEIPPFGRRYYQLEQK
ncbi:MAG: hypothetical protein IT285_12960, partial [Bdellovibrionales bacterium]|nr:hypothetical protein [Bdellovibrionales bacterium]